MPTDLFANAAGTTLAAAITVAGSTSYTVTSGVKFPTVSVALGTQFRVIIDSELYIVTDSSTTAWTVAPASEGTTAATHVAGAAVTAIVTAGGFASKAPRWTNVFRTAAYTAVDGDIVMADATAATFVVTLPSPVAGRTVAIRKMDATANVVTVTTPSGTIDGLASRPYAYQYQTQKFVADGTNWQRLDVVGVTAMATTGTPSVTTFLRGDGAWAAAAPIVENVNTVATSGAAQTIPDVTTATSSRIVLTAACTFTFPTLAAGKSFTLVLVQDATGGRTAVWPASVLWPGGVVPVLTATVNKRDVFTFVAVDATNWLGFTAGLNF